MPNLKQSRNTEKILDSTIKVLNESGYSSLTIEAIAIQAGVGKSTIYRWWDSKADLVLDAFLMTTASTFQFDTKSLFVITLSSSLLIYQLFLTQS